MTPPPTKKNSCIVQTDRQIWDKKQLVVEKTMVHNWMFDSLCVCVVTFALQASELCIAKSGLNKLLWPPTGVNYCALNPRDGVKIG